MADAIVRMMMQHAGTSTGEREEVALNDLVEQNLNLAYHGQMNDGMPMNVLLDRDYSVEVGHVKVQPQEMGRVLLNLFNNAFYAVHKQAEQVNGQFVPQVRVQTRRLDGAVEIRVSDNGPGIPADVREKIYEPFYTTKPPDEGTSLGLSLSRDIVVQGHGGRLTVGSEEGRGATFVVTLPTQPT
jgi:C4-dicarboxylate-specific signal transduction histidine kinase